MLICTPAPSLSTRVVLSFWSRPIGMQTIGTPAASPFITIPWPAWVTRTDASAKTWRCGAACRTWTLRGAWILLGFHRLTGGEHDPDRQSSQCLGYFAQKFDLVLVDGTQRDENEGLAALPATTQHRRPTTDH